MDDHADWSDALLFGFLLVWLLLDKNNLNPTNVVQATADALAADSRSSPKKRLVVLSFITRSIDSQSSYRIGSIRV